VKSWCPPLGRRAPRPLPCTWHDTASASCTLCLSLVFMCTCYMPRLPGCLVARYDEYSYLHSPPLRPPPCTPRRPTGACSRSASSAVGPFGALSRGAVGQVAKHRVQALAVTARSPPIPCSADLNSAPIGASACSSVHCRSCQPAAASAPAPPR